MFRTLVKFLRGRLQISVLILSKFKRINYILFLYGFRGRLQNSALILSKFKRIN